MEEQIEYQVFVEIVEPEKLQSTPTPEQLQQAQEVTSIHDCVRPGLERARARRVLRLQGMSDELVDGPPGEEAQKVVENVGLAAMVAHTFIRKRNAGNMLNPDIQQVAQVGLLKAIRGYDESRGIAFSTYAVNTISGTLKNYLRDHSWLVRPPRTLSELRGTISKHANGLQTKEDIEVFAKRVDASLEQVREAMNLSSIDVVQLDEGLSSHSATRISGGEEIGYSNSEVYDFITHVLRQDKRRIDVFLMSMHGYKNIEIMELTGLTNGQVSRIIADARTKLKEYFADLQC